MGAMLLATSKLLRSFPIALRYCSTASALALPYGTISNVNSIETDDNRLINRADFRGVPARNEKREKARFPETVLSKMQENLGRNYRISASSLFLDVVKRLEGDDEAFVTTLQRSSARWLPMIFRACGSACSNIPNSSRQQILARLWKQVDSKGIPLCVASINALLSSLLEIDCQFNSFEVLKDVEEKRKLEPDHRTFELLLENLGRQGDVEGCRSMQALGKFGADAVSSAQGACAKAAAARVDLNRLRKVLRRAVMGPERKLILSASDVLETVWLLAEKSRDGDGAEFVNLTEQMLDHTTHEAGFFRQLIREVERHITHQHYYTAIALLEDTNKIADCLKNQQKSLFLNQMIAQLSRQVVRSEVSVMKLNDIANRVVAIFKNNPNGPRIHDDLLYAVVMYKEFSMDKKMEYVNALLDMVDRDRTRPHLILPLLAGAEDVEERLKIIFRCSNAGYKDLSELDVTTLSQLVLQPLYDKQRTSARGDQTRLDKTAKILRSFGVSRTSVWQTLYSWWQERNALEKKTADVQSLIRPFASELQGWLKENYALTFEAEKKIASKSPPVRVTYDRLKKFVDDRDSSKVHAFLSSYGWPDDTNYEEIIPGVLQLYLDHEEWGNVKKMLILLSAQSARWQKEDDPSYSPVKNYHLLQVLPTANYDTFFNTMHEYNRLFGKCFERLPHPSVEKIDDCIDLLRTLVKLEILQLHPSETLTSVFISNVLKKLGWEEAVNTWMKFQSSLYCSNVLHKGQNFLPQSRVHCLYAAVLVAKRQYEEASCFLEEHKAEIDPSDCVMALRFMYSLKAKMVDEEFVRQFVELSLKHTKLGENEEAVRQLQTDWIRTCEQRKLAPLALRLYDIFKRYGISLQDEEKLRLRWIYEPEGFLRVRPDDELVRKTDVWRIQQALQSEISGVLSSTPQG
ncbi:unnamed protein product [Nippostrongylus brasiliensis]|uniref:RAP domain-containing protein n=1 Tax=Nippostrongylus brasiliensis TaxID=27835 RepID=A0A158QWV7_NIPBR|nr:unnamed protein product [Nippostrongylus brasiliensis]